MSTFHDQLHAISGRLARRAKWASVGVYRPGHPIRSIRVAGKRVTLSFPEAERGAQDWELRTILFDDCYRLASVDKQVRTILDIGANVGLFALAAHHHFANAAIHCYEPNPAVLPYLRSNCAKIGAHIHEAAVGETEGFISLQFSNSSLQTVAKTSATGTIPVEPFSSVVRALGYIDLLKLDCEGAEWEIFRCKDVWQSVGAVVMEFHLWAKPDSTLDDVHSGLREAGFSSIEIEPSPDGPWGFAWAKR